MSARATSPANGTAGTGSGSSGSSASVPTAFPAGAPVTEQALLAVVQAPDLGALRGRDHRSSSSDRRGAPAWQSATGSTGRRPHTAWARAPEPGRRQGRRVWPKVAVRRKSDPSRGAERDRRAAGRGGRGALRDCADVEPAPPAPTAGDRTSGRVACSRRGRGRRPRRPRRERRNGDSCAGGAGRPRRRSAQGGPRLDSAPNPWHNGGDWLGLSELETVTRVPDSTPGPHPAPESAPYATRTRCSSPAPQLWTPPLPWAQRARPPELAKPRRRGFAQRPQLHCCCWYFNLNELNDGPEDRQVSRFAQFYVTADSTSVDRSNPAICGHRKSGHFRRPETGVDFYFRASFERKAVWTLVRQLRGPHLSTWA